MMNTINCKVRHPLEPNSRQSADKQPPIASNSFLRILQANLSAADQRVQPTLQAILPPRTLEKCA
jgi:hypothetical protein